MKNDVINIDKNDPLRIFMERQVDILSMLLMLGRTNGDWFTDEHSEKVLWKSVIGTSSEKLAEKGRDEFLNVFTNHAHY